MYNYESLRKFDPQFLQGFSEKDAERIVLFTTNVDRLSITVVRHQSGRVIAGLSFFTEQDGAYDQEPDSNFGYFESVNDAMLFFVCYALHKNKFSDEANRVLRRKRDELLNPTLF